MLGISGEKGAGLAGSPEAAVAAIRDVVQAACFRRRGKRDVSQGATRGSADALDEDLLAHLKARRYFIWFNFKVSPS